MNKHQFNASAYPLQAPGLQAHPPPSGASGGLLPARQLLYTQVHDILQKRILDGNMPEGSYLPNEFDLSREFQVSIGTIRKAVDLLVEDDLVSRQQGRGTTVNDRRWNRSLDRVNRFRNGNDERISNWQLKEIEYSKIPAEAGIAAKLAIGTGETVHYIHRLRSAGTSWKICERLFIPAAPFAAQEFGLSERQSIAGFIRKHKLLVGHIDERLSIEKTSIPMAKLLGIDPAEALLKLERTLLDKNDVPYEFRITLCLPQNGAYWLSIN